VLVLRSATPPQPDEDERVMTARIGMQHEFVVQALNEQQPEPDTLERMPERGDAGQVKRFKLHVFARASCAQRSCEGGSGAGLGRVDRYGGRDERRRL
jgi:hypothetical protein